MVFYSLNMILLMVVPDTEKDYETKTQKFHDLSKKHHKILSKNFLKFYENFYIWNTILFCGILEVFEKKIIINF